MGKILVFSMPASSVGATFELDSFAEQDSTETIEHILNTSAGVDIIFRLITRDYPWSTLYLCPTARPTNKRKNRKDVNELYDCWEVSFF
jgi:hypothetical protein